MPAADTINFRRFAALGRTPGATPAARARRLGVPADPRALRRRALRAPVLLCAGLLAACGYVPPAMIVPSPDGVAAAPPRFGTATLAVAPVTRFPASAGELFHALNGAPLVSAPMFRKSMIRSLRNANLFAAVSAGPNGENVLHADVVKETEGGYGALVEVRYVLHVARGRWGPPPIWSADITTAYRYGLDLGTFLLPNQTNTQALWQAFRRNQAALIARLATLPIGHGAPPAGGRGPAPGPRP